MWILACVAAFAAEPELVAAAPFALEVPYADPYRADHPPVSRGQLVTLRVEPGAFEPRAVGGAVLFAGDRPVAVAARAAACLVAIVPAEVDLAREPVFAGPPLLPEQLEPTRARELRDAALARGVRPQLRAGVRAEATLRLPDEGALYRAAMERVRGCE